MHRRALLTGGLAMASTGGAAAQAAAGGLGGAAAEAYVWGLPLLEFARVRARALGGGLPPNRFHHMRPLADHRSRSVTTPNNDTVYSTGFLDLRQGPVTLTLPPSGERYLSVQLMDAYTNSFAVLGTRTTGPGGGRFVIAGPRGAAPEGAIRAPTTWVWALGRTLVDGPEDLAAAHSVQDGLVLAGPAGAPPPTYGVGRDGPGLQVLRAIAALRQEFPPPSADGPVLARIKDVLALAESERPDTLAVAAVEAGVDAARRRLAQAGGLGGGGPEADGWGYPRPGLGNFGQDYGYRAAVAINGLGALPREEAIYMRPIPPGGRGVFEGGSWRLRFEPGRLPPLVEPGGFWSLTMYQVDAGGQLWLVDNPLNRYAVGDRTEGLRRESDGALELRLSADDPGEARRANWLPAPRGPWTVVMRTYLPGPDLLEGRYRLSPIERA
jgi:hypothetical protein